MSEQDPTANYRKYPKSPNFLGIVIASALFILIFMAVAYLVMHRKAEKLSPRTPNATPNALLQRLDSGVTAKSA